MTRLLAPLAFAEGSIRSRIKNILNYRKPSFWMVIVAVVVVLIVSTALISNPLKAPELKTQALAPGIRQGYADAEGYLYFDVGALPRGITVRAEGFDLESDQGEESGLYRLGLHDLLVAQNSHLENPFVVRANLIYSYRGRTVKKVSLSHEVHTSTPLHLEQKFYGQQTVTTADHLQLTGSVAPGAMLTINGLQVVPDADNHFSYVVQLPHIGVNDIVVRAERSGEAVNQISWEMTRMGVLGTNELASSLAQVTGGIATDMAGVERPVAATVMQDVLRRVLAAPTISRPEQDIGRDGVGFFAMRIGYKETRLHVADTYVVLNDMYYQLPATDQALVTAYFHTPYEWPYRSAAKETDGLYIELQGAGVQVFPDGAQYGPTETILIVYDVKDMAAPVIERIVEVSPGKFEICVRKGNTPGLFTAVAIHGWDEQREFTVKR